MHARRLFQVATAVAVVLSFVAVAGARPVAAKEVFRFSGTFDDVFGFDHCGFPVEGRVSGRFHDIVWADPGAGVDVYGDLILTAVDHHVVAGGTYANPANGKSLEFFISDHFKETLVSYNGPVPVTLPDGSSGTAASYTLSWDERGVPVQIKLPRGGVISIDAGLITDWVVDVIFYYFDVNGDGDTQDPGEWFGQVVAGNDPVVHGPHPLFGTDRFCEIVNQYLA